MKQISKEMKGCRFQTAVFDATMESIEATPSGLAIMGLWAREVKPCHRLLLRKSAVVSSLPLLWLIVFLLLCVHERTANETTGGF